MYRPRGSVWICVITSEPANRCDRPVSLQVLWAQFLPEGSTFAAATGGVKHVRFWTIGPSGLTSKKGTFGAKAKIQPMLCAATINGELVTGTVSGEFYIWTGNTVTRVRG